MSTFEHQLRGDLTRLADEVRPVALLHRLDSKAGRAVRRRRLAVAAVAAAAVAVVSTGGALLLAQTEQPRIVEPLLRPPKVFRLSDVSDASPGRVRLAVMFPKSTGDESTPVYVLPADGSDGVLVPPSDRVPWSWVQVLSADGTRLVRQRDDYRDPRMEIVNLLTGRSNHLSGTKGYCPVLSPDNATVSFHGAEGEGMKLVDVRTGAEIPIPGTTDNTGWDCGLHSTSWSPDGSRLAFREGASLLVADRDGDVVSRLPGKGLTNASMSWSPDGRSLLLYDSAAGAFSIADPETGRSVALPRPTDAVKPLGWAGSRVVWLAGAAGDQRLVSADRQSRDVRTWMLLDVGDRPVGTVAWTQELGGTATD